MLEQRWLCTEIRVGSWVSTAARWAPTLLPSPTRVDLATALDHRRVACSGSPVGMLPKRHAEVPHACLTLLRHELPARLMRRRAACYGSPDGKVGCQTLAATVQRQCLCAIP